MIKRGNELKKKVDSATRVKLIREGNKLFSQGKIDLAEKIFITIDYRDGLIRLGDYYLENNDLYKCARMYFMSGNDAKINAFCKRASLIITKLLKDDDKSQYSKIIINK